MKLYNLVFKRNGDIRLIVFYYYEKGKAKIKDIKGELKNIEKFKGLEDKVLFFGMYPITKKDGVFHWIMRGEELGWYCVGDEVVEVVQRFLKEKGEIK
jgi:hypothetical protein